MKDNIPTPTTDIAILVRDALTEASQPDRVKEIVTKLVTKQFDDTLSSATRSFSAFGQTLEKKVTEALSIEKLDLPSYNTIMAGMVAKLVDDAVSNLVHGRLKEDLNELFKIAPKTIKLSEIVNEMRQRHEGDGGYGEVVTCIVQRNDHDDTAFWGPRWTIYLDEDRAIDLSSHRAKPSDASIRLDVWHGVKDSELRGTSNDEIHTGTINSVYENGGVIASAGGKHGFTMRRPYALASRLLSYYACETVIEVDEDSVVTSVGDY